MRARWGVRSRLFGASVALILVGLAVSTFVLERQLEAARLLEVEGELARRCEVLRLVLPEPAGPPLPAAAQARVRELAAALGVRISLIGPEGRVVADSVLAPGRLPDLAGHGDRPEVVQALREGQGVSHRFSSTVGRDTLNLALRHGSAGGVVRVSTPLDQVEKAVLRLRTLALVAAGIGLVVAVFMSWLASRLAARTLENLVRGARALASGDSSARVPTSGGDELGVLADSFNRLAAELDRVVEALGEERDRFAAVLEGMDEAVLALDGARRISLVNRAARELLDLPAVPEGQPLGEVVDSAELRALLEEGPPASLEIDLPGEPRRRVLATLTAEGRGGSVLVLRDVTRLRHLETIRRDFVANVSHELRTPLAVIRANAETLIDGALHDKDHGMRFLGPLHENAERLAALIADLLDISRIESGKVQLERREVPVAMVARQVVDIVSAEAARRGVVVEVGLDDTVYAMGDEQAILQVLRNLIENAVKYIGEGGKVEVRATPVGDRVRVEVLDDGPGIAPRHRERIFERFYRVDEGRDRYVGGTGLGLAIVKHLVTGMGGTVGLDGREPTGSNFWFELGTRRT